MKKIAILSLHYGMNSRGAEVWIDSIKENLGKEFDIQVFRGISEFTKWKNSDVVISIDGRFQVFIARILTWLTRKPMIVFGHSGPGADDKWNLLCSPDVFIAFSTYQKGWVNKYKLPWTRTLLIPHAVDTERFTPDSKRLKRLSSSKDKKVILCVAANRPDKRIDLVRRAVLLIPNAEFIVVGAGNEIEVPPGRMPDIYKKADVFCFVPQPWEAFGLVFLEAMASNLPVVTTNDPVRKEIVGEAGILVDDTENTRELANAINSALSINWGNRPREQADKFSWDKVMGKYVKLFNNPT